MYKGNKNLHTSIFIKIVIYYKLNNYDTRDDRINTSAYYSILALIYEEVYYIADGDFKDKDVGIDDFEDKDISVNNFEDKDIGINNSAGESDLD